MTGDLEQRLTRFTGRQPVPPLPDVEEILRRAHRRKIARVAASCSAALALAVVAVVGLTLLPTQQVEFAAPGGERADGAAAPGPCRPESPAARAVPSPWSAAPAPPLTLSAPTAVWTSEGLLVLGAGQGGRPAAALYQPDAGTWRCVAAPPANLHEDAAVVWTGQEAIVWNGEPGGGAVWNASTGTWRALPPAPLEGRSRPLAVWTGDRMIAWGGVNGPHQARTDGAAYDPTTDAWTPLPDAPLGLSHAEVVWTGQEMIVFGARLGRNNVADTESAVGAAYDPSARHWRLLAPSPLSPQASSAVWLDGRLIAWDYLLQAAAYDSGTDTWTELESLPLGDQECPPASVVVAGRMFAWYCTQAATYDPSAETWAPISVPADAGGTLVEANGHVILVGTPGESGKPGTWIWAP